MANSKSYIPDPDNARAAWLTNFAQGLEANKNTSGITGAMATATMKDAKFFAYVVSLQDQVQGTAEAVTAFKNEARDGSPDGNTDVALTYPVLVAYPVAPNERPEAVPPGIFRRAAKNAATIKAAPGYTISLGEALGIEAPDSPARQPEDFQPSIGLRGYSAGHPILRVRRDGASLVEVFVDRGDGSGWVQLTILAGSEYTDMHPQPAAGTAKVWRYRAICRNNSGPIGQMSEVLSVTVTGI